MFDALFSLFRGPKAEPPKSATVVIPVRNEQETIPGLVKSVREWQAKDPTNRRFVVVNDGSTDKTVKLAEEAGAMVIHSDPAKPGKNLGKGEAIYAGLQQAKKNGSEVVVTLDGDLSDVRPKDIESLVSKLRNPKKYMAIARANGHRWQHLSGQRAIRTDWLDYAFSGNKKDMLKGYGFEKGMNYITPRKRTKYPWFVTFYEKRERPKKVKRMLKDFHNVDGIIRSRRKTADTLREYRGAGMHEAAKSARGHWRSAHTAPKKSLHHRPV